MTASFAVVALIGVLLIITYVVTGVFIENKGCPFGHEASLVILLGAAISFTAYSLGLVSVNDEFSFNDILFFYFFLPPIVFSAGFNMKRRIFFENFGSVLIFGVLSTVIQFVIFSFGLYGINETGLLKKWIPNG